MGNKRIIGILFIWLVKIVFYMVSNIYWRKVQQLMQKKTINFYLLPEVISLNPDLELQKQNKRTRHE